MCGAVADKKTATDLKMAYNKGDERFEEFLKLNILCEEPDMFTPIKKMKLHTFTSMAKAAKVKKSNGTTVPIKSDCEFWARLILISRNSEVNLRDVFDNSLREIPRALATDCGDLNKTVKSKLFSILKLESGDVEVETVLPGNVTIIDAMALLQSIKGIPDYFEELACKILKSIIDIATFNK